MKLKQTEQKYYRLVYTYRYLRRASRLGEIWEIIIFWNPQTYVYSFNL
jgi:hypothetical protein